MSGGVSLWPPQGSGSGGGALAANVVDIGSGASSIDVVFAGSIGAIYAPIFSFINTTDAMPIFLQGIITAKSATGFTVTFNASTDTANYKIAYAAMGVV